MIELFHARPFETSLCGSGNGKSYSLSSFSTIIRWHKIRCLDIFDNNPLSLRLLYIEMNSTLRNGLAFVIDSLLSRIGQRKCRSREGTSRFESMNERDNYSWRKVFHAWSNRDRLSRHFHVVTITVQTRVSSINYSFFCPSERARFGPIDFNSIPETQRSTVQTTIKRFNRITLANSCNFVAL